VPITIIENADWIVHSIFLAIFCYDPRAIRAACIHVDGNGHPENMGTHEQLRFSSPSMRLSHLSHIILKVAFKEPFSVSSSLDKLVSYFGSKLVSQFLLGAVARCMLFSPQAGTISDGPEQASTVPCDSDGAQRTELPIRHPPVPGRRRTGDPLLLPLPAAGAGHGRVGSRRTQRARKELQNGMGWNGM